MYIHPAPQDGRPRPGRAGRRESECLPRPARSGVAAAASWTYYRGAPSRCGRSEAFLPRGFCLHGPFL